MKPVLFIDFDGTLCHDRFWRSLKPEAFEKITIFTSRRDISRAWMRGAYTSEDINKIAAEETGILYEEIWEGFVADAKTMSISQFTLEKISSLRDRYFTVLMTDNMDCFDRFTVPAFALDTYFDKIFNSHTEKRGKNDDNGQAFLDVAAEFGLDIQGSILIDNSPSGCEVFSELGGKSLLVTKGTDLDYWLAQV